MMKTLKLVGLVVMSLGFNFVHTGCERHEFEGGTEKLYHHGDDHGAGEHGKETHKAGGHAGEKAKEPADGKKVF